MHCQIVPDGHQIRFFEDFTKETLPLLWFIDALQLLQKLLMEEPLSCRYNGWLIWSGGPVIMCTGFVPTMT